MNDYIKREDAINVFDWGMPDADVKCGIAIQNIKDIPSADVVERSSYESMEHTVAKLNEALSNSVEVVRCKDCKYRHKEWHHDKRNKNGGYWISWCANDAIAERVYGLAFDYDYCSYGEETRHEV